MEIDSRSDSGSRARGVRGGFEERERERVKVVYKVRCRADGKGEGKRNGNIIEDEGENGDEDGEEDGDGEEDDDEHGSLRAHRLGGEKKKEMEKERGEMKVEGGRGRRRGQGGQGDISKPTSVMLTPWRRPTKAEDEGENEAASPSRLSNRGSKSPVTGIARGVDDWA